ncbi:10726_t:CDS:2, partial [Gigaspora margarita]
MRTDIWEKWLHHIDSEFRIQDRKILLLVDNALSHSSSELSNNTNKTLSVNNVEVDDYQLNSENEDLMDDFPAYMEDHAEAHAEDYAEAQAEDHAEAQAEDHAEAQVEDHVKAHVEGLAETHIEEQEPTPILLMDETKNLLR